MTKKKKGCPSERTQWNIVNNCPASQRKSLAGLDNVAYEGSDAFDELISICKSVKNEELESLMKDQCESLSDALKNNTFGYQTQTSFAK